jgi:hypothetical protein
MFKDLNRFRKPRRSSLGEPQAGLSAAPRASLGAAAAEKVVYQLLAGDTSDGGTGHWVNYDPHVSAHLEMALESDQDFAECRAPVSIDGTPQYMVQRITRECPFDYIGKESREQFLPEHVVRVDHSRYGEQARIMDNCFVQFQTGNPMRRRPVRRITLCETVFQCWTGDTNSGGEGSWKNYDPLESALLEMALKSDQDFAECRAPVSIDGSPYMVQRITRECPFDYIGKESREQFLPEHVVRVDHSLYDGQTDNCFVQFQKNNPMRRRQVRRIPRG